MPSIPLNTTSAVTTPAPAAPQQASFFEDPIGSTVNFANGLYEDADTKNWTLGNAGNLALSAGHGLVDGTAYLGSFAYANTVGWFTGQSTDEVHKNYVGAAVDTVFENTVGMPDLSGHWAQAVHFAGEMGLPTKAAGVAGIKLVQAFNLADKVGFGAKMLRGGTRFAPQMVIGAPTPSGP